MFKNAKWIGIPKEEIVRCKIYQGDMNNRFAYFCKDFLVSGKAELKLEISANSRYRLWINEIPVLSGPCKGDRYRQYSDEVDLSTYLKQGKNRIAIQVLSVDSYIVNNMYDNSEEVQPLMAIASLPAGHRLAVEGKLVTQEITETDIELTTGRTDWYVLLEDQYQLYCQIPELTWFGAIAERFSVREFLQIWKKDYPLEKMVQAIVIEDVNHDVYTHITGMIGTFPMKQREIPLMYEKREEFCLEQISGAVAENGIISIEPDSKAKLILSVPEIKCGYPVFRFEDGQGTSVKITYAERYVNDTKRIRRDDYPSGRADGFSDIIELIGGSYCYEPFWYRTFRFIEIEIKTEKAGMKMEMPYFQATGFPIEIKAELTSSEAWVNDVWKICTTTLERCMNETYMDCPYYEQMQFPMDTRLQMLYSYLTANETRLAKKAIQDFHYSKIPDGLIQGKYPGSNTQIISTFSLHYIWMLWEYYMQTGDSDMLYRYRADVDEILEYYRRKQNNNLVENLGYWEFVDWQDKWTDTHGMPMAAEIGPSTIINLMYAFGLWIGAKIYEATGRPGVAAEYRGRHAEVCQKIKEMCWSETRGMFREGPSVEQYSIHAQAWAVLNGMLDQETGAQALTKALEDEDVIPSSFSTSFEIFQAFFQCGIYEKTDKIFLLWKKLSEEGCTTCPETPENARSECHAWSAQPIYEFICHMAGIRIMTPGWTKVEIAPQLTLLPDLKGSIPTPMGTLFFEIIRKNTEQHSILEIPGQMQVIYKKCNGETITLTEGKYEIIDSRR